MRPGGPPRRAFSFRRSEDQMGRATDFGKTNLPTVGCAIGPGLQMAGTTRATQSSLRRLCKLGGCVCARVSTFTQPAAERTQLMFAQQMFRSVEARCNTRPRIVKHCSLQCRGVGSVPDRTLNRALLQKRSELTSAVYVAIPGPRAERAEPGIHNHRPCS
jgi:hypothetical protein